MRLINLREASKEVKIGDIVFDDTNGDPWKVVHFREPHKAASSGKITVEAVDGDPWSQEFYVGTFHLKWIEREDQVELNAEEWNEIGYTNAELDPPDPKWDMTELDIPDSLKPEWARDEPDYEENWDQYGKAGTHIIKIEKQMSYMAIRILELEIELSKLKEA